MSKGYIIIELGDIWLVFCKSSALHVNTSVRGMVLYIVSFDNHTKNEALSIK